MEYLSLREPIVFDCDAKLVDNFFGWDVFFVKSPFKLRVQLFVIRAEFADLLNRVEAFNGRNKLFSSDLAVSIQIDKIYPFPDLERSLLRQKFFEAFLQLELTYTGFAIGFTFLKDNNGIDLTIS